MGVLLAAALCATPPAAVDATRPFAAGGWIGLAHSGLGGAGVPRGFAGRTRYTVGGFLSMPLNPGFTFEPRLMYVQRGAHGPLVADDGSELSAVFSYDYIDLDLAFGGALATSDSFEITLLGGPSFAYNLSAEATVTACPDCYSSSSLGRHTDLADETADFEAALMLGAAGHVRLKSGVRLAIELRYRYGLTTIDASSDPRDMKNRTFTLLVGTGR